MTEINKNHTNYSDEQRNVSSKKNIKHSYLKEVADDILFYIPAKIIPSVVSVVAIAVFTRLLKTNEYGLYVLTMTSISITISVGFNWLNNSCLRFWEENKNKNTINKLVSNIIILLAVLFVSISVLWYGVVLILKSYLSARLIYLHKIGIIFLWSNAGFSLIISILRAKRETFKYALYSSIMSAGGTVTAIFFLYFFDLESEAIFAGMAIFSGGIFIFEMSRLYREWGFNIYSISSKIIKKYIYYGVPLIGVGLYSLIISASDRYMIAYYLEYIDVAKYSAVYSIVERGLSILFNVLLAASFPIAIQVFEIKGDKESDKEISIFLSRILSIYFVVLIPALIAIIFLSKEIIHIMLPKQFINAMVIVPWIAFGIFFFGMTNFVLYAFKLKRKTNYLLVFIVVAILINIILNIILIPSLGIYGAAVATMISYLSYLIFVWFFSRSLISFLFPWKSLWKSIVAVCGMSLSLFALDSVLDSRILDLGLKMLVGLITYTGILIIIKEENVIRGRVYFLKFISKKLS